MVGGMVILPLLAAATAGAQTPLVPLQEDYEGIVKCIAAHLVVIEADQVPRLDAEPRIRHYIEVAHRIKPEGAQFDREVLDRKAFLQQAQAGMSAFNDGDTLAGVREETAQCDSRWADG